MNYAEVFDKVVSLSKEHGFIFQSSEIYDGLGAVYDYGPLGVQLKRNLVQLWWDSMTQLHDNIVGLDAAILMHPTVWKASGHVDAFNDPLIDNRDSKKRYRADVLIEDELNRLRSKAQKEADKKAAKEGWTPGDEAYQRFLTHSRYGALALNLQQRYEAALNSNDLQQLGQVIAEFEIAEPETGSRNWTEVRQFNLMFGTQLGALSGESQQLYLRPETAQGIFVNYLNVQKTQRMALPFGIAQVGKAFRNEIVARQFVFRMREFEQMEMQFFVRPGEQMAWFERWKAARTRWHEALGLKGRLQEHVHEKLAHYADAAVDLQFEFPFWFKELEGIHSRTDFDLRQHEEHSKKKLRYFLEETRESIIPYVVETSVGLDRSVLAHLCNAYDQDVAPTAEEGQARERTVLRLHPLLAPYKVAVFPLVKKEGLPERAQRLANDLRLSFPTLYDEDDTVGRRYRRQDLRGTPYCVTVDMDTLNNDTVTVRERDSMQQHTVHTAQLPAWLSERLSPKAVLEQCRV